MSSPSFTFSVLNSWAAPGQYTVSCCPPLKPYRDCKAAINFQTDLAFQTNHPGNKALELYTILAVLPVCFRSIKPSNIQLSGQSTFVLFDFEPATITRDRARVKQRVKKSKSVYSNNGERLNKPVTVWTFYLTATYVVFQCIHRTKCFEYHHFGLVFQYITRSTCVSLYVVTVQKPSVS